MAKKKKYPYSKDLTEKLEAFCMKWAPPGKRFILTLELVELTSLIIGEVIQTRKDIEK